MLDRCHDRSRRGHAEWGGWRSAWRGSSRRAPKRRRPTDQPRGVDQVQRALHRRPRRRSVGAGGDRVGRVANARVRGPRAAGRARQRRRRAGMWHGVRRRVAEAPWCAAGRRRRPHSGAARHGPAAQSQDRSGPRVRGGERRSRSAPRRGLRSRDLRVRRLDLVRSLQVDPRGGATTADWGRARLSSQLDAVDGLHARRGQGRRDTAASPARHASPRVVR